jgi:hypothetical protein
MHNFIIDLIAALGVYCFFDKKNGPFGSFVKRPPAHVLVERADT